MLLFPNHLFWCSSGFPPVHQCLSHTAESKPRYNVSHVFVQGPNRGNNHFPQLAGYDATNATWYVVSPLPQRHTADSCSTCSARGPLGHFPQSFFLASQPPDCAFVGAYSASDVDLHWVFLAKFHAACGSPFLQHIEIPLKTNPALQQIDHSSPLWICLWFTHLKLQVITYMRKHQISTGPREMSLITGHQWDLKPLTTTLWAWQSRHFATHFVVNTSSILTRFDHLTTIIWKIRLKALLKSSYIHWSPITCTVSCLTVEGTTCLWSVHADCS